MMDYKSISTSTSSNLKLLCDDSSETIDATMYRKMIGLLMYLMNTRLAICFVVNTLSQFLTYPRNVHPVVANHVLRYLKGTIE